MAVELEQTIMREIGLGNHYNWFNGSGSCAGIAREAVDSLSRIAKQYNLAISVEWMEHCRKAVRVDTCSSNYTLTNTWITCSYAIQDAICRAAGDNGFEPIEDWYFWSDKERHAWHRSELVNGIVYRKGFGKKPARFDFDE
jgi:pyrroloquinoline quinone (PQQ) biosynthesis protein C